MIIYFILGYNCAGYPGRVGLVQGNSRQDLVEEGRVLRRRSDPLIQLILAFFPAGDYICEKM